MAPPARSESDLPASERIRARLVDAQARFHANDNIAAHVRAGELDELKAEVQANMQAVLRALVIDTDGDHNTQDTAARVAKMFVDEVFRGRYQPMPAVTEFPNVSRLNELMIVGPITVRSACHCAGQSARNCSIHQAGCCQRTSGSACAAATRISRSRRKRRSTALTKPADAGVRCFAAATVWSTSTWGP